MLAFTVMFFNIIKFGAGSFELGPAEVGSSGEIGGEESLEAFRRSSQWLPRLHTRCLNQKRP
jgi:hypothetical protein